MAGAGSRRHCEEFIVTGRVTVDGRTVTELGARVDPATQLVRLDGERVRLERPVYYLLNKPTGVLCTNYDPAGRPRVIDFFPQDRERLFTVGRLDENSQGLILVTNDGELAHRLARIFLRDREGRRPVFGGCRLFDADPCWRDLIPFHEYFHGDSGRGCGASHQTGWTGLIAQILLTMSGAHTAEAADARVSGSTLVHSSVGA